MKLSHTANKTTFVLERPDHNVLSFEFMQDEVPVDERRVTIRIPAGSRWRPGPHWHEQHIEHIQVLQGDVALLINGKSTVVTPSDGVQTIPRYAVHEWMRADIDRPYPQQSDIEVVAQEWTDPCDGSKEVFFRNLLGTLGDASSLGRWLSLQIMLTSSRYDQFDVFLPGPFSRISSHALRLGARLLGFCIGLRPWYEEYTPKILQSLAGNEEEGMDVKKGR